MVNVRAVCHGMPEGVTLDEMTQAESPSSKAPKRKDLGKEHKRNILAEEKACTKTKRIEI